MKLWVKEPTRARGEIGVKKRVTVAHKRALSDVQDEQYARRKLANVGNVTDTLFGTIGNILRKGASSTG